MFVFDSSDWSPFAVKSDEFLVLYHVVTFVYKVFIVCVSKMDSNWFSVFFLFENGLFGVAFLVIPTAPLEILFADEVLRVVNHDNFLVVFSELEMSANIAFSIEESEHGILVEVILVRAVSRYLQVEVVSLAKCFSVAEHLHAFARPG